MDKLLRQPLQPHSWLVNYFVNANTEGAPDGTVQLTNVGATGGNLYAAIYVFYPDEEMAECCACFVTPDDLRTLSINENLTANPLTGIPVTSGTITIVSSSSSNPVPIKASAQIRAWGTHVLTTDQVQPTGTRGDKVEHETRVIMDPSFRTTE